LRTSIVTSLDALVARATADPHVAGLILTGSQARDMATEHSDHDVLVVVPSFTDTWPESVAHTTELDTISYLLEWLSDTSEKWSRWQFRGARVLLDRTDGAVLAGLCAAQATLTPQETDEWSREYLDGYINQIYRAAKNRRDGRHTLARLELMESVAWFLDTLFALHGRVRPYNKYLRWELRTHPLGDPWHAATLPERLADDPASLWPDLELLARERGYGDVIDGWVPQELALLYPTGQ
jgi:hypothetical protein